MPEMVKITKQEYEELLAARRELFSETKERHTMLEFQPWPKIPRTEKISYFVTEKLDGTNAALQFSEDGEMVSG